MRRDVSKEEFEEIEYVNEITEPYIQSKKMSMEVINKTDKKIEFLNSAHQRIDEIEAEFYEQTKLKGKDEAFLFLATGLQCARIFFVNNVTKIEKAGTKNKKEHKLHKMEKDFLDGINVDESICSQPYYASTHQIIRERGVPYDATGFSGEKTNLFKGANHRFATLGHDPVLGLVFGTSNILTNTITCVNKPMIITNHVVYDNQFKNPRISVMGSTIRLFEAVGERINEEPTDVAIALIRQIIHIGTDLYTPCGIQLPLANLILDKRNAERLTQFVSMGDVLKVGANTLIRDTIIFFIKLFYSLMYQEEIDGDYKLYMFKLQKIIDISNIIAQSSNCLVVGIKYAVGNKRAIKDLDIVGLTKTVNELIINKRLAYDIKREFVMNHFIELYEEA